MAVGRAPDPALLAGLAVPTVPSDTPVATEGFARRRFSTTAVELNVTGGGLQAITRARLEQILSSDHDLRMVLFDGGRPLA